MITEICYETVFNRLYDISDGIKMRKPWKQLPIPLILLIDKNDGLRLELELSTLFNCGYNSKRFHTSAKHKHFPWQDPFVNI